MNNPEILKLVAGFAHFRKKFFAEKNFYEALLKQGQNPKTLIIACSDSRVDPAILSNADPGDIFVVRNVANLVPPYEVGGGKHGVSAAMEFAVRDLKVNNVVILGHSFCGGIRALMTGSHQSSDSFIGAWVKIAQEAKESVLQKYPSASEQQQCHHCEMESIAVSLKNIRSFPFVEKAVQNRAMRIYGIYFDLEQGELFSYNETQKEFRKVELPSVTE